jgi:hypothetical protein
MGSIPPSKVSFSFRTTLVRRRGGAIDIRGKHPFRASLKRPGLAWSRVATLIAVCTGLMGTGAASAGLRLRRQGCDLRSWSGVDVGHPPAPDPRGDWSAGADNIVDRVSCASATFCMASGYDAPAAGEALARYWGTNSETNLRVRRSFLWTFGSCRTRI